jgi:hypothetical protein
VSAQVLYGIAASADAAGAAALPAGAGGEPLRLVELGPIVLVTGEVAAAPELSEEALRAHDAAARALHAQFPAFLPARFGSCADAEGALREAVQPLAAPLDDALTLVRGREQMTLRLFGALPPGAAMAAPSLPAGGGPGARYLARLAREQAHLREVPELDPLRPLLRPFVRAEQVQRAELRAPADRADLPRLIASVFHLVDRGSAAAYAGALERGLAEARAAFSDLRVSLSGPWPAWSFAPELP